MRPTDECPEKLLQYLTMPMATFSERSPALSLSIILEHRVMIFAIVKLFRVTKLLNCDARHSPKITKSLFPNFFSGAL